MTLERLEIEPAEEHIRTSRNAVVLLGREFGNIGVDNVLVRMASRVGVVGWRTLT